MRTAPPSFGQSIRSTRTSCLRIMETRHPQGLVLERHEHQHACINFVLAGCYPEEYGPRREVFLPFWSAYKPAGEPHVNRFTLAAARTLLIEILDEECLPPGLERGGCAWTRDPHAAGLALRIWRELAVADGCSSLSIDEWGSALCARVLAGRGGLRSDPRRLRAAADVLHDDPRGAWTLSGLARHVGLHPSHLARAFRARHGCTIGEYLRRLRLNEVARRLALGDEPISVLSAELGFADQSHCTRSFRLQFGTTPASYRRRFRGERSPGVDPEGTQRSF
jgi:AraC family transcriptional regulator